MTRRVTNVCQHAPTKKRSAMSIIVAIEKSLLRTIAFVLYQLDRNCARYCASSILHWYMHLQTQLPGAAVDSLDRVTDSVISLSGAEFIEFWRSLVAKELDEASGEPSGKGPIQTPCTSPVDYLDTSYTTSQLSTCHHPHESDKSSTKDSNDEEFEPGWAIEYMEQDSGIPSEMSRRMAKMMHSNVATNLFRVTVSLNDDRGVDMEALTPGSFPPTPITRDLQTRRMHHYTITVLDHATLTLRLLTEGNGGS